MASRLEIVIAGSTKLLESSLRSAKASTSRFSKGLNAASVAGGAGLVAMGIAARAGFAEFQQGELVAAQTAAAIKSTGGAAGVTATQVDALASALMRKSGVDDEQIKTGANLLLTFTRVRNEAGRGNDVFNQATKATLDLSVAMGKDMSSSAVLVGKALNDPVKGMSALTRAGIQFTPAQKAAVKAMTEAGDSMGAQKLILRELEKQFGGSAAAAGQTFAGKMRVAKEESLNLAGDLVGAAIPALTALVGIVRSAVTWFQSHTTTAKVLVGVFGGLAAAVIITNAAMRLSATASAIAGAAKLVFTTTTATATGATVAQTGAQTALNTAMRANPIGIVITALAALGAGLVLAWRNSETFRGVVTGAFGAVKTAAGAVRDAIGWVIDKVSALLGSKAVAALGAVLAAPFDAAIGAIRAVADTIQRVIDLARAAAGAIRRAFGGGDPDRTRLIPGVTYGGGFPRGAHGAIVTRPTVALIGEAGAEAVVPLSGTPGSSPLPGGRGGAVLHFHFPNYAGDHRELVELIRAELIRAGRRMPGIFGGLA